LEPGVVTFEYDPLNKSIPLGNGLGQWRELFSC